MEENFRSLLDSLNRIPSFKDGKIEKSRGKFELIVIKNLNGIEAKVIFIDRLYPNDPHCIIKKYFEFSETTPSNIEELFIKSLYDDFIRYMLYGKRIDIDDLNRYIRSIPVGELIQTGIDKIE